MNLITKLYNDGTLLFIFMLLIVIFTVNHRQKEKNYYRNMIISQELDKQESLMTGVEIEMKKDGQLYVIKANELRISNEK